MYRFGNINTISNNHQQSVELQSIVSAWSACLCFFSWGLQRQEKLVRGTAFWHTSLDILYVTDHGYSEGSPHYPLLRRPGSCQGRGLPSGVTNTEAGVGSAISAELFLEPLLLVPGKLDLYFRGCVWIQRLIFLGNDRTTLRSAKWLGLSERPTNLRSSWWLQRVQTIKEVQIKVN